MRVGLGWVAELPGRETDAVRPGHVDAPRHWSWHPPSSTRTARPGRSCAPRPPAPSAVPAVSAVTRPSTAPAPRVPRGDGPLGGDVSVVCVRRDLMRTSLQRTVRPTCHRRLSNPYSKMRFSRTTPHLRVTPCHD
ncbi:hypothetical protein DWC19_25960 [Streptomyces sp. M7]|nr:hypothetical protein DWC19_25960 [Streptomyces sp. M7]